MSEAGATGTEQPEEAKELEAESNVSSQTPSSSKAEAKEKDNEQKKDSSFFSKVTAQYKSMSKDDKEKVLENAGAGIKQLEEPISPEKKLQESRQLTSKEQHQKLFEDMDIDSIRKRSQEDQSKAQKFINRDAEEQELLEQASNLTDSELISHASAGLLLRGLRQDSKGGWTRCKRRLVCVPEDARLVGSQIGDEVEEREFYEASQFDSFMRSLGSMNKSFSSKLQCDVFIVKGKGGVDDTRQDESCHHTETHVKSKFYSKAHIVFVPTAACYLQPNKLSQEATKELKIIEHQLRSLDWEHTENSIRVFMSKFGSHATSGTVHFGGILAFEASYSCVENESLEVGKSLVSKALDSVLRAGVGRLFFEGYLGSGAGSVSYSKLKTDAKNENEFNSEQISRVSIRTKKIGGPIEVSSEPSWRRGLASSNRTWHVVKCDAEIVPVWDLFLKEDLEDAKKLAQSFKLVWVKDNSRADLCPMGIPNELEHALINYNLCLKDFAKHAKKSSDSRLWNEFFKKLLKSIATIERFTAPSESGSEWTKNDDLTIVLREFVNRTDFLLNSPESEQILASVKRLIQISGNVDFPEKQKVAAVIYFQDFQPYKLVLKEQTVVSPKDFVEILRSRYLIDMHKFLQEKGVTAFPHDHEIQVLQTMQPELTSAVNQLLESLTVAEQFYSKFVTACVLAAYGFSHNDKQFRGFLDIQQVKQLADTIELETTDSFFVKAAGKDEFIQAQVLAVYCRHVRKVDKADRKWLLDICESLWLEKIRKIIYEFVQSDHKNWQNLKAEISNVLQQYQKDGQAFYVNLNPLLECTDKRDAQSPNKVESIDFSNSLTAVETFAIQALGLNEFWPGKLSMSTVMKFSAEAVPNDTRIGLGIIKQLAMTNYNFRNSSVVRVQNLVEADKDGCGDVWSDNYQPTTQKNSESVFIPFCDALLFCFLSASTQLKQALTEKLFDCKLAIPLLYSIADQNYLFTWTLRGLVLKFPEQGSLGGSKELIVDTSLFSVVSLIRLGTSSFSKSIIANRCINKKHDVFTVSGKNSLKKKFTDGSIELAWMLPEENDKSGLPGAVCVLNLRVDAMKHSEQRDFLASVSSYVIVVLPGEDYRHSDEYSKALQQLYLSKTRLVILVTTPTIPKFLRELQQTFKTSDEKHKLELLRLKWTDAENSTIVCLDESDIAAMLKEVMFDVQRKAIFSEELTSLACFRAFGQRMKWILDDATDQVGGPIESAQCLFENICNLSDDLAAIKRKFLPLQGRLCIEISQRKKQRFRKNRNMVGDEKSHWVGKMDAEIQEMRREQIILLQKQLEDYPQLMPAFLNFTQSSNPVEVFLQQLAIKLNALSIDKMTVFRRELESIWQKILKSEDTTLKSKEHFLEMENVLNDASFGLEHIFREVGQIYEAIISNAALSAQNQEFTWSLARFAANLLLQGHALEIIDGDTSSVATMWLQAVLNQVEDIVGAKRLLVLSVLGIQSSGKSTLLNTMFGLRFPVSAGRCTRGAFMQLVRNEPEESGLNVDYVAVVDTEGLRAPELGGGMKEHDNELATMVIGLADVVLINIMGEGLSEISDVLQIVVHAFIRMKMAFKSVLLGKGCIFLHQNVAAVDSVERLRSASSRLLLELNKTVETAAGEEGAADLKRFTDIIDFDPDEDVCYWPHLWEGSPPNAPVNPDYSRKAQQAREKILKKLKQFESSKMSFKNLSIRFCDLWDAVLKEDFVFSFQNTLELKAYKEVECKFTGISFNFESCISDWVRSYGAVKMRQCGKIDRLEVQLNGIEQLLRAKMQKEKETAQHELTEFLAGHELSHISKKWEQERLNNLETSSRRIEESSMQMLQGLKEEQRVTLVTTVTMDAYQRDILSRARTLAERTKGEQVGEEQKTEEFEKMWNLFVGQVTTKEEIQWTAPCEAEKAVKEEFRDVQSTTLDEEISRLKAHKDAIFFRFILWGTFQESYVLDEHYSYSKPLTARIGLKKRLPQNVHKDLWQSPTLL
ncbi:hypothetical protein BOX15_Mlig024456g1 [Macrostomum lignano]|uniref:VLIG-type G domain-containing protein n=1 Tax=Macrostomum lignano TaxID=282301 RepID=A0A267H7J7_9PLAT|nr:hypothetical protein BOX15_Mlig024456g1 [Macrostomum lignano]